MNGPKLLLVLGVIATLLPALALPTGAAPPAPDLVLRLWVEPHVAGANLTALLPALVVIFVENTGSADAGPFEVDVWTNRSNNSDNWSWPRHSLGVSALAAGANVTITDPTPLVAPLAGPLRLFALADPAGRVPEDNPGNNAFNTTVNFALPAAQKFIEEAGGKLSGTRTLAPYSLLALRVNAAEGDSLIFQADAAGGGTFDCYLFDAANFGVYLSARERADPNENVSFFKDYSRPRTEHIAFTTEPLPAGTYFVVVENDERLLNGAAPTGPVTVTFAVARVNNSLPPTAIAIVIGAAAAAIWATVRWRPVFDVRSPLLEVTGPELSELEDDGDEADPDATDMGEGEGPPPHPP